MCTTSDEEPDVSIMRSVPATWVVPTTTTPRKLWDDSGAGGGKPGSMWLINSMDMAVVVAGHEPPTEVYYEFASQRFFIGSIYIYIYLCIYHLLTSLFIFFYEFILQ
jgi:hypothetical protein